jgi:nanoRNase/pAp phosphatase (c-di-AMP/oligoRNAs hydrolase)
LDIDSIRGYLRGKVSIICHHNADPDAICAAYSLEKLIHELDQGAVTEILYPDSASQLSDRIINHFNIDASVHPRIVDADTVVVVDTGNLIQLEILQSLLHRDSVKIFIDHHSFDPEIEKLATLYILDDTAVASCEIIHDIWQTMEIEPPKEVAEALLLGIAFDSKHFSIGASKTFRIVAHLLELGATLSGIRETLQSTMDVSEKVARLKSAQRMILYRVDPWIIVTSNLGSFQPSAARGILNLGADVAIIAGNEKEELKASLRSTEEFHQKTGIHLGDHLSKPLSEHFKGAGGGHPTAAGINGYGDADALLMEAADILKKILAQSK